MSISTPPNPAPPNGKELLMVARNEQVVLEQVVLHEYDDGPDYSCKDRARERAFRQGFVEEARRVVREWAHPPGQRDDEPDIKPVSMRELMGRWQCCPFEEVEAAHMLRRRVEERFTVYRRGDAGRKTYHLGFRPGHALAAARLRGRHHAMAYVVEPWLHLDTSDIDIFDPKLLCPWLRAVEQWAATPIRPNVITPPPRPLEVVVPTETEVPRDAPTESVFTESPLPRRLTLTRADQIEMRPPDWLLRGMLERDTFALVFGDPGCGKTFVTIDWACRVATGTPWRGHSVAAGPVVYVAGEGRNGLGRRFHAWQQHHGVSLAGVPLFIAPAVAIPEPSQLAELVVAIDEHDPPALIVLDTLARAFGGGDENSTQDMSRFVSACDALRRRYGCTILVVHHTGHADKSRARGAIALKAALDAEYRLSNDAGLLLTATKMKDAETPQPLAMELVTVDLSDMVDDYGNPVTSAAIEVIDADTGAIVSKARAAMSSQRGKWQEIGVTVARRLIAVSDDGQVSVDNWRDGCKAVGMVRQNQHRVLNALSKRGDIVVAGSALSLPNP